LRVDVGGLRVPLVVSLDTANPANAAPTLHPGDVVNLAVTPSALSLSSGGVSLAWPNHPVLAPDTSLSGNRLSFALPPDAGGAKISVSVLNAVVRLTDVKCDGALRSCTIESYPHDPASLSLDVARR
jgi:hypothetical protein